MANCRVGDLAVIVKASKVTGQKNVGRIVEILGVAKSGEHYGAKFHADCNGAWFVRAVGAPLTAMSNHGPLMLSVIAVPDHRLRPIRDQHGDDETLTWAGLPRKNYLAMLKGEERAAERARKAKA